MPAVAVLAALVLAGSAGATLPARLTRALESSGVPWSLTGALVTNLATGRVVYARGTALPLRPASNEKLAVTIAALDRLGPRSRIRTEVIGLGKRRRATWRGSLFLKGYGDPTLSRGDLRRLARRIHATGIERVTGAVAGDESYFDTRRVAPGWKASFYKLECPPLSALVVGRAKVHGTTVSDPAHAAAKAFRHALRAAGISVAGRVRVGVAPGDGPLLAHVVSKRLSRIVRTMNHQSDNFAAEMLVKRLGAVKRGRGTTRVGLRVVRHVLKARRVPLGGVRLADGSGLSLLDRLTARAVEAILRSAWGDDWIRPAFYDSLPRAGLDGTLEDRMEKPPARRIVRAKTGTTNNASALSGFVAHRFVFSILQNGNPVPWWSARRSQDRFAQALARRAR